MGNKKNIKDINCLKKIKILPKMLLNLTSINKCFEKIMKKAQKGMSTIVILVAYDIDSFCACHILTNLLKSKGILYSIYPVSSYTEMDFIIDSLEEDKNV